MGSENELCPGGVLTVSFSAQAPAADGLYTWTTELRRDDAFALTGSQPTVHVDGTPPATTIDSGPAGPTNDLTPTFAFSANEGDSTFECSVDGGAFATCSSPYTAAALADGAHTFEVRAIDPAGNVDATPADRAITVDTTAPETTIDSGPSGTVTTGTAAFTFSSEANAVLQCSLDGALYSSCTSPAEHTGLGNGSHNFRVRAIDAAGNVDPTPAESTWTVTDPTVSIGDVTLLEGTTGTSEAIFTVSLNSASDQTVTVDYATANGIATAPADYTAASDTLTFAAGETTKQVEVSVIGDSLDEPGESFLVNLTNAANATLGDNQGVGTIIDDDPTPSLSIDDKTVAEGAVAAFTVTLSAASGLPVSVDYASANGTAIAPGDYDVVEGQLDFAPGETLKTIPVSTTGDALDEAAETYTIALSNATNATIADDTGIGTIDDDDAEPSLSVNDVTPLEGDAGPVGATFTISLTEASSRTVSVDYSTANGTATAPADYTTADGNIVFDPGQTIRTVTVQVNGDLLDESAEDFSLNLSDPLNATIADGTGLATITDNDPLPDLWIGNATVTEGSSATFTVTLDEPSGRVVTVDYATADNLATGPADYAPTSGSLIFAAGETSKTVVVATHGDLLDEANETFFVNLSNRTNANFGDSSGVGTITDDDLPPALAVNDRSIVEGDSGTVDAIFTVSLDAPSGRPVTVNFATVNGTATAPSDYVALTGPLTFNPGQTARQVTVSVKGDALDEVTETYFVNLSVPINATLGAGQGVGTIIDDDGLPSLVISDAHVTEGNSGTVNAEFTITLTGESGNSISVGYTTGDITATVGTDYTPKGGNLVFDPHETTKTLTVPVRGDVIDEVDETFLLGLMSPINAEIGDGQGVATITDDDPPPSLSVADVDVVEGDAGTSPATFTVTLNPVSGRTVTVGYATANGSAIAPEDYESVAGTMTFEPGETTKTVGVPVKGDSVIEADETFVVNLSNVVAGSITDGQAVGTIANDDAAPPPPPPAEPPPPPPPAQDTTPPGEVRNVRVKAGDETATISWANPSDADFQGVSVRRISSGKSIQNLAVYEGVGTTITQRGLKNGSLYRYRIKTRDRAGNTSTGIVVTAVPKSALLGPAEGAIVTAPPLLRWAPFPRASYYNAQLYLIRGGGQAKALRATKVLSVWPNETRYKLRKTWRFGGKRYRLVPGRYRWYVWPGLGKVSANRYGPMLGESTFTVKVKRKR
jgi:hypothetical protein